MYIEERIGNSNIMGNNYKKIAYLIFAVAVAFRVFTAVNYGPALRILSDDNAYLKGAIGFLKNGHITAQSPAEPETPWMPGNMIVLAALMRVFGYSQDGLTAVRICLGVVDGFTTVGIYLLVRRVLDERGGVLASAFYAVGIPIVCMCNLFLSDSLATFGLIWFLYFALKYCDTKRDRDFLLMFFFYFFAVLMRATMALVPVVLVVWYAARRFPLKLLISRCIYAAVLVVVLLSPWWYRNYLATGTFLPTTSSGAPLLEGTYAGGLSLDDEMSFAEAKSAFYDSDERDSYYKWYDKMEEYGKQRIKGLWEKDKAELLKVYLTVKPKTSWMSVPQYGLIYDIGFKALDAVHRLCLRLAMLGAAIGICKKKYRNGTVLCCTVMIYFTFFGILFLPYPRYMFPAYPLMYALAGLAIVEIVSVLGKAFAGIKELTQQITA